MGIIEIVIFCLVVALITIIGMNIVFEIVWLLALLLFVLVKKVCLEKFYKQPNNSEPYKTYKGDKPDTKIIYQGSSEGSMFTERRHQLGYNTKKQCDESYYIAYRQDILEKIPKIFRLCDFMPLFVAWHIRIIRRLTT